MTHHRTASLVLAALILGGPAHSHADGAYLTPPEYRMVEPVQQALLEYDSATGTERLTIQPGFQGDAAAFVWLVPVPGLPTVAPASRYVFSYLSTLTRPAYRDRDGDWDCFQSPSYDTEPYANGGVEVISQQLVGYYDALVLGATEAPALFDSLTTWGFLHAGNEAAATAALADYIADGWYFVAMRVDTLALAELESWNSHYLALDPVQLTFAAAAPVYPMKISALSASDVSEVHLYVAADHRMTFAGADTYYANHIAEADRNLRQAYPLLAEVLRPGVFLTRLYRGYRAAEMTEDVYLQRAPQDDEFRLVDYGGFPVTGVLLLGPPAGWLVWRRRRPRYS
jgi:hypothetical protein